MRLIVSLIAAALVSVAMPAQPVTLPATPSPPVSAAPPPPCMMPVTSPEAPTGTAWIFHGTTGTEGDWQLDAPSPDWDTTPYRALVISIKPGVAGMSFVLGAESSTSDGGFAKGSSPVLGLFCDNNNTFKVGQWIHAVIPLHAGGFNWPMGQHLRKIKLLAQSPVGKKSFFIADVGFIP
jgi:hypothetical protein